MTNKKNQTQQRRVAIITDTYTHIGPHVARELAQLNHDLCIGSPQDGLADELKALGAQVEVVEGIDDLTKPQSVQTLVDRALDRFGKIDAACFRSGKHISGDILNMTAADLQELHEYNVLSVMYALQAILPPMIKAGSGQVVVNTSSAGARPSPFAAGYSATRAAANMLIRNAAHSVAQHGITVNAIGTNFMNYPGFCDMVGFDDPQKANEIINMIPLGRLGEPAEAAHVVVAYLDGKNMYETGTFIPITGGWIST